MCGGVWRSISHVLERSLPGRDTVARSYGWLLVVARSLVLLFLGLTELCPYLKARIHTETAHIRLLYPENTPQTIKSGQEIDLSHTDLCLRRLTWKCEYRNNPARYRWMMKATARCASCAEHEGKCPHLILEGHECGTRSVVYIGSSREISYLRMVHCFVWDVEV